jgi:beta-lactamase superfamily II metal-dependent hydrolase
MSPGALALPPLVSLRIFLSFVCLCCAGMRLAAEAALPPPPRAESATTWTMVNVTPNTWQADFHLLEFPDGTTMLVDVAEAKDAPPTAIPYLQRRGLRHIDLVIISHCHWDHYGRLRDLIEAGITVGRVAINVPASREIADREIPWGLDWEHLQALLTFLREKNIPTFTPRVGDVLVNLQDTDGSPIRLEVLCAYDGVNTPIGMTTVNDTSVLLRLTHGSVRALFTGDLDEKLGAWLVGSDVDLRADILKVPHHGGGGHPPNPFYDRVAPVVALVPISAELWAGDRCTRMRTYLEGHKLPHYVTGVDGDVTIRLTPHAFYVRAERGAAETKYLPRKR